MAPNIRAQIVRTLRFEKLRLQSLASVSITDLRKIVQATTDGWLYPDGVLEQLRQNVSGVFSLG